MCNDSSIIFTQKCSHLYNNLKIYIFFISLQVFFLHCVFLAFSFLTDIFERHKQPLSQEFFSMRDTAGEHGKHKIESFNFEAFCTGIKIWRRQESLVSAGGNGVEILMQEWKKNILNREKEALNLFQCSPVAYADGLSQKGNSEIWKQK